MKKAFLKWFSVGVALCWLGAARGQEADDSVPPAVDQPPAASETGPVSAHAEEDSRWKHIGDVFRFGGDVTIRENEEAGSVVVIFGDANVDGKAHDLVVVGGNAKVNGIVGDLVVPMGSAELGPKAHVDREAVIIGGPLEVDPAATMDRNPVVISWSAIEEKAPAIAGVKNWVMQGLILGRPLPHRPGWWWTAALACALIYLLTAVIFVRPITASVAALESQPVGSFFVGVLGFILFGPLLLLLVATGVGIVIVPFVICGAFVAFLFGKVAVYRFVGQQIGKQMSLSVLQLPLVGLLIGIAVFYLLYMVPVLGFLTWVLIAPLGFGAATLALFRAFRSEGVRSDPPGSSVPTSPAASSSPPVIPGEIQTLSPIDITLLPRAGFWARFAATFLDLLLIGTVSAVIQLPLFFVIVWPAYHIALWTWKGTTVGGIVFGIKIFRREGRPLDFAVALVRSVGSFFSGLALFIGFFWAGWTREKLAWHDMIAGTIVVKMPKGIPLL